MQKKMRWAVIFCIPALLLLPGCGSDSGEIQVKSDDNFTYNEVWEEEAAYDTAAEVSSVSGEGYSEIQENTFQTTAESPVSTFSADVDTASYSNLRRMIQWGYSIWDIPADAVRIEELLNYFSYDYNLPEDDAPFGVTVTAGDCPWNGAHQLVTIGLKSEEIDFSEAEPSNLVFLLDVSGSMQDDNKLPLLQQAFTMLSDNLTEKDRVSIVTYAGTDAVLLEGCPGNQKATISAMLSDLEASGSTNGSAGIETAYALAEKYFIDGGNNRVILATDGDLNVGVTSEEALSELISEKKESGIYLTTLGFGTGNLQDNKLETLADDGNGVYAYIDSVTEARKVLVEELGASMVTVAEDVKLQVTFEPSQVAEYRLIGYENRMLSQEDFEDDTKDAGEIGAGHTVTAMYEVALTEQAMAEGNNAPWLTLDVRYKDPGSDESKLLEYPVTQQVYSTEPGTDFRFAACVAEFGMVVRNSSYRGDATLEDVADTLAQLDLQGDAYKEEFRELVDQLR
ncbi:MAG: von Willebrand factor type A domain-containing protein [Ruminococcus sp.]